MDVHKVLTDETDTIPRRLTFLTNSQDQTKPCRQ